MRRAPRRAHVAAWLGAHHFKGEKHRVVLVPDRPAAVMHGGRGPGQAPGELCRSGMPPGLAERLPPRQLPPGAGLRGGRGHADRARLRLRSLSLRALPPEPSAERAAVLELPGNADVRYVSAGERGARAGARLDQHAGVGSRAGRARGGGARRSRSASGARFREWVGEELLADNFPAIHAVGRASAEAPRLVELRWSPPGRRRALPRLAAVSARACASTSGGLDIKPAPAWRS